MCFAARAGLLLVDQSGIQVGIDGHLLAGHGVESETRRDFGRPHCAVADDHVLNGDQGQKQHEADDVIAADHELPESFDDPAGCGGSLAAMQQNAAATREIERQPQQRQQQQETGKDRELHRTQDLHCREQNQDRNSDAEREQKIEDEAGQRHQHDEDQADGKCRDQPVGSVRLQCGYETGFRGHTSLKCVLSSALDPGPDAGFAGPVPGRDTPTPEFPRLRCKALPEFPAPLRRSGTGPAPAADSP